MSKRTIWKFPIVALDDIVGVQMPRDAQVLTVQFQRGILTLWAIADPAKPHEDRLFRIIGTGGSAEDIRGECYIGTAQDPELGLVWHVFEHEQPEAKP